jgi:hypothetical protein
LIVRRPNNNKVQMKRHGYKNSIRNILKKLESLGNVLLNITT